MRADLDVATIPPPRTTPDIASARRWPILPRTGAPRWLCSLSLCLLAAAAPGCTMADANAREASSPQRELLARGNALCRSDLHCAEAVPVFAELLRRAPPSAGILDDYAKALRAARRWDEALAASDRAIALRPDLAFLYYGRARDLEGAGRLEAALDSLERAIRLAAPSTPASLWESKGRLLGLMRRYPEAHAAYDRALVLDPARLSVFISRADVELAEGRLDAALADLQRYPADGRRVDEVRGKLEVVRARMNAIAGGMAAPGSADGQDRANRGDGGTVTDRGDERITVRPVAPSPSGSPASHAQALPQRFQGLWGSVDDAGFVCRAAEHRITETTDDERVMVVRATATARSESGCTIGDVSADASAPAAEGADATTVAVSMACGGEGNAPVPQRELWAVRRVGGRDLLVTAAPAQGSIELFARCEDGVTPAAPAPMAPSQTEATPSPEPTKRAEGTGASPNDAAPEQARAPSSSAAIVAPSGQVDACNSPRVLGVMTGDLDKMRATFHKTFAGAARTSMATGMAASFDQLQLRIQNIRQQSYDPSSNTRRCAADYIWNKPLPPDLALVILGLPVNKSLCAGAATYVIETMLDRPDSVYVTHQCW